MSYQSIRTDHVNGIPPNCDPQRPGEDFNAYKLRMAANGFPPDINVGETDSDYVNRINSYNTPATSSVIYVPAANIVGTITQVDSASFATTAINATNAVTATDATNASSSSYATSASLAAEAVSSSYALSASFAAA